MSLVESMVLLGDSLLRKFHEDSYNILSCNLISGEELFNYSGQEYMQKSGHLGTNYTNQVGDSAAKKCKCKPRMY